MGCTRDNYDKKHIAPGDEREIALLNSFAPKGHGEKARRQGDEGLSRNKMCIGCAWDGSNLVCIMEGYGKPSKKHTWESFSSHIKEGSKLIHDGDKWLYMQSFPGDFRFRLL